MVKKKDKNDKDNFSNDSKEENIDDNDSELNKKISFQKETNNDEIID